MPRPRLNLPGEIMVCLSVCLSVCLFNNIPGITEKSIEFIQLFFQDVLMLLRPQLLPGEIMVCLSLSVCLPVSLSLSQKALLPGYTDAQALAEFTM